MIFFKVFVFLLIWFVSLLGSGDIENFDDLVNFLWIWFVVLDMAARVRGPKEE